MGCFWAGVFLPSRQPESGFEGAYTRPRWNLGCEVQRGTWRLCHSRDNDLGRIRLVEMVVQREQERQHLDKTEGGGQKDGSEGIATCRWPPSTQTLDGTTQER